MLTGKKLCKWSAEKRRTVMPSDLKDSLVGEGLGEKLVIVKSMFGECLNVYSEKEWDEHISKMRNSTEKTETSVWMIQHYVEGAVRCDIDAQGRFVLPKDETFRAMGDIGFCEYAKLDGVAEVIIRGSIDHAEIWSPDNLAEHNRKIREAAGKATNEELMKEFSGAFLDFAL